MDVEQLPRLDKSDNPSLNTKEKRLWDKIASAGILLAPGYIFAADERDPRAKSEANFRMSFSNVDVSAKELSSMTKIS